MRPRLHLIVCLIISVNFSALSVRADDSAGVSWKSLVDGKKMEANLSLTEVREEITRSIKLEVENKSLSFQDAMKLAQNKARKNLGERYKKNGKGGWILHLGSLEATDPLVGEANYFRFVFKPRNGDLPTEELGYLQVIVLIGGEVLDIK